MQPDLSKDLLLEVAAFSASLYYGADASERRNRIDRRSGSSLNWKGSGRQQKRPTLLRIGGLTESLQDRNCPG